MKSFDERNYDKISTIEEQNPLLEAKKSIEERLTKMEGRLYNYALQSSMAGSWDGTLPKVDIKAVDGFEKKDKTDVERFYENNGDSFRWVREFTFSCFGEAIPIEYRFWQKLENNKLVNKYERFSEKFETKIWWEKFSFENMEELSHFIFHIQRARDFKKNNEPVIFTIKKNGNIEIQTTYQKDWKIKLRKTTYYWKVPQVTQTSSIWVYSDEDLLFWKPDSKTSTSIVPTMDWEWNMGMKTVTKTTKFDQSYRTSYEHSIQGKTINENQKENIISSQLIHEKIGKILNQ